MLLLTPNSFSILYSYPLNFQRRRQSFFLTMDSFETYELEFGTFKKFDRHILGTPHKFVNMEIPEAREVNRVIGLQYTHNYG